MTVKEFYTAIGGDYDDALRRLMKEERIAKYLNKFVAGDDYELLNSCLDAENYEEAFRHVHNLKGVSANLSLTPVFRSSDVLCEALRHGKPEVDITGMLADVKRDYEAVIAAIKQLG